MWSQQRIMKAIFLGFILFNPWGRIVISCNHPCRSSWNWVEENSHQFIISIQEIISNIYIQPQNFKNKWYLLFPTNYFTTTIETLSTMFIPFVITFIATHCRDKLESTPLHKPLPKYISFSLITKNYLVVFIWCLNGSGPLHYNCNS